MSDDDKSLDICIAPQVKERMMEDPKTAEAIREMNARLRQVMEGIDPTDYEAVAKALRGLGFEPVTDVDRLMQIEKAREEFEE